MPHNQGSMAFVVVRNEIEKKELNGEECDRISFFKFTHFKEGKGWMPLEVEAKYNEMIELKEKSSSDDKPLTADEICDQVLGTRSGYIKGLGYGLKPKKKAGPSLQIKRLADAFKESEDRFRESEEINLKYQEKVDELTLRLERQEKMFEMWLAAGNHPPAP
ncbi:hypothetical protein Pint_26732 [Pistacia integerrima]|uniref:Uncharacterized protein n=1 Tax=Pistacia integerrima TaxID=434235 RepID=A0ACC0YRK5_9ROSI|nr:hypothetical protein Pint_26732 [Pistacia integerrima]